MSGRQDILLSIRNQSTLFISVASWEIYNGNEYEYFNSSEGTTFNESESLCVSHNAHLASLLDSDEETFAANFLKMRQR